MDLTDFKANLLKVQYIQRKPFVAYILKAVLVFFKKVLSRYNETAAQE